MHNNAGKKHKNNGCRLDRYPPELLFHSLSLVDFDSMRQNEKFQYTNGKPIFCSKEEDYAWHVAHRSFERPAVAIIDVVRAKRAGISFYRNKKNLWQLDSIPTQFILNAHPRFQEQVSAGGIPVFFDNGVAKLALIKVQRPNFSTWEIAKGKLEMGESPKQAAIREIQEEMGHQMEIQVIGNLGIARFGLYTPEGEPRLKTLYMYLLETGSQQKHFTPALKEGILEVAWFTLEEAKRAVTHRSLFRVMKRLEGMIFNLEKEKQKEGN